MKKLLLFAAILFSIGATNKTEAQVGVNVNINIGSQPLWGPVGYDYVQYYYLPDIEAYYYVPRRQFVYLSGGNWIFSYGLPPMYRGYDLYSGYKVVINRPRAYVYHDTYKVKYKGYKGNRGQAIIRSSNDSRYYVVKGHPKYNGGGKGVGVKSKGGGNPGSKGGNKGGGKGKGKGK